MKQQTNFKWINGFEGLYQINEDSDVRSVDRIIICSDGRKYFQKGRIMKQSPSTNGRLGLNLCGDKKIIRWEIHVLMGITFLGYKPKGFKLVVDHKDDNYLNNNLSNLHLVTQRENLSRRGGSSKYVGVCWHKQKKKWRSEIKINGKAVYLGAYTIEEDARDAYQNKLKTLAYE